MHTVFALLCFVVVIHWLIFPYPSGLLHWHCGNLTIAPVPAKQPWWIWINTSCEFIMNDCITTTSKAQQNRVQISWDILYFEKKNVNIEHNSCRFRCCPLTSHGVRDMCQPDLTAPNQCLKNISCSLEWCCHIHMWLISHEVLSLSITLIFRKQQDYQKGYHRDWDLTHRCRVAHISGCKRDHNRFKQYLVAWSTTCHNLDWWWRIVTWAT